MNTLVNGLISTPMTPFDKDNNLELGLIDEYTHWQALNGVKGFYILGTWGGFAIQTIKERIKVAKAFQHAAIKYNMQLIVNISSLSFLDTENLAKEAEDEGITAISSTLPIYYSTAGYLNLDQYKRYFSNLMKVTRLPIYLYNNPRTTNILITPSEFTELANIGLKGVKDGSKDIAWLLKTQNKLREKSLTAEIIPGNSVGLLYGFLYGCNAVTSGASVVFPKESVKILNLIESGNYTEAAKQHRKVLKLREIIGRCSCPPSAAHFLLNKYGSPLGYPRINWPSISDSLGLELVDQIEKILSQN